jgi:precorrin isomerase
VTVHPIEAESFAILAGRVDLGHLPAGPRAVVARVVHATADLDFAGSMVLGESDVAAGVEALRRGAPVVCDVEMVRAGLTGLRARTWLAGAVAGPGGFPTRSAMAVRAAAAEHPEGALVVVGCAPTALEEVLTLVEGGTFRPALVVGMPVGFVGAAESKAHLRELAARTGLAAVSNIGEKGGSAAACGVVNALARLARDGA